MMLSSNVIKELRFFYCFLLVVLLFINSDVPIAN